MFNARKINFIVALFVSMAFCATPVRSRADDSLFSFRAYPLGGYSFHAVKADFDGDGIPDIAAADYSNPTLHVLRGVSGKGFEQVRDFALHATAFSLITADLNGDGKPDLVSTHHIMLNNVMRSVVTVTLNASSGGTLHFQAPVDYYVADIGAAAVGDTNGDGKPDIVFVVPGYNDIGVLLNDGNGGFTIGAYAAVGLHPSLIALGDVNGDGKLDVVTANDTDYTVRILNGVGNGNFTLGFTYTLTGLATALALADLDGDGKLDILFADPTPIAPDNFDTLVRSLHKAGSGAFTAGPTFQVGSSIGSIVFGDADGDGKPDLAVFDVVGRDVSLFLNKGQGQFSGRPRIPTGYMGEGLFFFDVNGDGRLDMVFGQDTAIVTLTGHGDGTFDG